MNRPTLALALSALTVPSLLVACSGSSQDTSSPDPVALVKLAKASNGGVASTQSVYGSVERNADSQYNLSAPVEATVSRIVAPVGSAVGRGQLVVALTPSPTTRSALTKAQVDARVAGQALARAQRLRGDGLASDADVETASAAARGADAALAALRMQAAQLALRAPGPGFVQTIPSMPGDLVNAGTTVATISRKGNLRARLGIDPALLGRLSRGAGVRLDGSGITVPIVSVDPSVDATTRLAGIFVTVPASLGIEAGQSLSGQVTLEQSGNAITVPYDALLDDGGQPYVYVVSQGLAHRRDVKLGATGGSLAAISKGLKAGEQVVTQGGTALEDGMKVRTK